MSIKTKLECIFCDVCGNRIGWTDRAVEIIAHLVCDDCKKEAEGR